MIFLSVVDLHRIQGLYWTLRWGQATVAVTRGDLAVGPLGMPHPDRLITHRKVGECRFNKPLSALFPAYTT